MSHDLNLVQSVCKTGMWLDKGRVQGQGKIEDVAASYSRSRAAESASQA
jgi:ABC-type polysaccharide/polyol phosphate transport system ATPase subunit